jgi:hypothetical protein
MRVASVVVGTMIAALLVPVGITTATAATSSASVSVAPRTIPALPGFRRTTVATFGLPAASTPRTVVLGATVTVRVPTRLALSVLAWCRPSGSSSVAPDARAAHDVLVIGQNPVPGSSSLQVASRTLAARAVVVVPARTAVTCQLQLSPRTETYSGSSLRLLSGRFTATAATVLARAAQRPAVLVGRPTSPGSGGQALPQRRVAVIGSTPVTGRLRVEGEAELTMCAFGYHLCAVGTSTPSVVDVRLQLAELNSAGRVCAQVSGSARAVTITSAVHHTKVAVPALTHAMGCGTGVTAWLLVTFHSGNAVEVEPVIQPARVQTHVWVQRAT